MKNIFFKPWVGQNYTSGINGKKILVLGESHHCESVDECNKNGGCRNNSKHECFDKTNLVMNEYFNYKNKRDNEPFDRWMNTFTKFANVFNNKKLSGSETETFYNSILFYNYVQYSMTDSRVAPSSQEFDTSISAFLEILDEYQPDIIIFWGKRLWKNIGDIFFEKERDLNDKIYYFLINDKNIPAFYINHPSSSFNYSWHNTITDMLSRI